MSLDDHDHRSASLAAAGLTALWAGLRLVVIDTETTRSPDRRPLRVVAVARVTCRSGTVRSAWNTLVNPGVPIDSFSQSIHGITDEHVDGEPGFAAVAPLLLASFDAVGGEQVVVVGHNIGFDIAVLRHELQLLGQDLPDLPVLDTMRLAAYLGVTGKQPKLSDVCAAVGVVNARPHDAHADALAAAEAAIALLARAVTHGITDLDTLLTEASSGTTLNVKAGRSSGATKGASVTPVLPPEHLGGHAQVLSARAGRRMLDTWQADVEECGRLRCEHLDERAMVAQRGGAVVLERLEAALAELAADGDTAGSATVLHALLPRLASLPYRDVRHGQRNAVLAWSKHWAPLLAPLRRCDSDSGDLCPACRRGEPCALDTWHDTVAELALGDPALAAQQFLRTNGKAAGTGVHNTWTASGVDHRIVDAALLLCVRHWHTSGHPARADQTAQLAWKAGCRHPDVTDRYAGRLAAPGTTSDLDAAIAVCDEALRSRSDSTHEGWRRLLSRRAQLAGRRQRAIIRYSSDLDADGNPIPLRRHHPTRPRRTRPGRFQRST